MPADRRCAHWTGSRDIQPEADDIDSRRAFGNGNRVSAAAYSH